MRKKDAERWSHDAKEEDHFFPKTNIIVAYVIIALVISIVISVIVYTNRKNAMNEDASQSTINFYSADSFVDNSQATTPITPATPTSTPTPTPKPTMTHTQTLRLTMTATPSPRSTMTPTPTSKPTASPLPRIEAYNGSYAVTTSSYRVNKNQSIVVDGNCAVDGNLDTAWNSNQNTNGEWIELATTDGRAYLIGGFSIAGGYWKNDTVYRENARPRKVEIYCDDQYVDTVELEDKREFQSFSFNQPVQFERIRFVIQSGYPGTKYEDCCITEIILFGP